MKICCQLPISMPKEVFGPYYDLLMQDYRRFKGPDTDIRIRDVPAGLTDPGLIGYYGFRALNDREIARAMITADSEGFDAIAGACYFDSGIKTASSLLPIPVVGAGESAMHLACMMGSKFAVITSEPDWIVEMSHHLVQLGFERHAIPHKPVRSLSLPMDKLISAMMGGDVGAVVDDFRAVADACLADGADVLIAGCGLISPMLSANGVNAVSGAPIVDPMISALKSAEMLVKLSASGMPVKSNCGLYRRPDDNTRRKGLSDLKM